jgi:hypothetical protein
MLVGTCRDSRLERSDSSAMYRHKRNLANNLGGGGVSSRCSELLFTEVSN